jgi:hypothetical protein
MLVAGIMADTSDGALPGTATCAHACTVLAALVRGNPAAQSRAAQLTVEWNPGRLAAPRMLGVPELCLVQLGRSWNSCSGGGGLDMHGSSGPPSGGTPVTSNPKRVAAEWAAPAILCLLVSFCDGCGRAVGRILHDPTHVPLMLEMVQSSGDPTVAGLAALLWGCCLLVGEEGGDVVSGKAALMDVLSHRLGIRRFFDILERGLERMQVRPA